MKNRKSIAAVAILLGVVLVGVGSLAVLMFSTPDAVAAQGDRNLAMASSFSTEVLDAPAEEASPAITENTGVVNTIVPFRTGPDTSSDPIGLFRSGQLVEISELKDHWVKVTVDGRVGYLPQYSVHLPAAWVPEPEEEETPEATPGLITGTKVRLRERPDSNSAILMDMDRGDAVSILDTEGDWSHVLFGEAEGYVMTKFITTGKLEDAKEETEEAAEMTATLPSGSTSNIKAVGIITGDYVRMRSEANTDASVIANLERGNIVSLTGTKGGWYVVSFNGHTGYMSADYVQAKLTATDLTGYAAVTSDDLNMRQGSNSSTSVVAVLKKNDGLTVTGFDKGWYAVSFGDKSGYVSGNYISITPTKPQAQEPVPQEVPQETVPEEPPAVVATGTAAEVISYAQQYLGVPYVYGGASPSGFDCSGFVMYVYDHFGISLPHGATPMVNCGTAVSKSDLQPGDLVIFSSSSAYYGHVGIYIGDGEFIHASSSTGNAYVRISRLDESYYSRMYQCARRIL